MLDQHTIAFRELSCIADSLLNKETIKLGGISWEEWNLLQDYNMNFRDVLFSDEMLTYPMMQSSLFRNCKQISLAESAAEVVSAKVQKVARVTFCLRNFFVLL